MDIHVVDHTANWREWVSAAVDRWAAALAYRGIRVTYEWGAPIEPVTGTPSDGLVHVTDEEPWVQGHWGDSWQWDSGPWPGGWIHVYRVPENHEFAIACVVHELGHTMGLKHATGNTVMTPVPSLAYPSASDATNAMRGYPLPVSPPPPGPPPSPKPEQKHKHDKRKKKKHGKH